VIFDSCTYATAHNRCRKLWGPASQYLCIRCGEKAFDWAYDGTDCTQLDGPIGICSRFPEFYMPLCHRCHMRLDLGGMTESTVQLGVRVQSTTKTRLENAVRKTAYERSHSVSMANLVDEILDRWLTQEGIT
jgi:hypothetical protein